jgi:hypothetical protein
MIKGFFSKVFGRKGSGMANDTKTLVTDDSGSAWVAEGPNGETVDEHVDSGASSESLPAPKQPAQVAEPDFSPMVDEMRIPVLNLDGTTSYVTYFDVIDDDKLAYVAADGKTYHTRAGCYRNWSPSYRSTFSGWKVIRVADAEAQGMHMCSYCQDMEYLSMNPDATTLGYFEPESLDPAVVFGRRGKPGMVFTATIRNRDIRDEDFSKDDEIRVAGGNAPGEGSLYKDGLLLCNAPAKLRTFEIVHDDAPLEMHVLEAHTTPKGFVSLRIAVYERQSE